MLLKKLKSYRNFEANFLLKALTSNKKAPQKRGFFVDWLFVYLYFGGSRKATAKNNVTTAKVSISTYEKASIGVLDRG